MDLSLESLMIWKSSNWSLHCAPEEESWYNEPTRIIHQVIELSKAHAVICMQNITAML